MGRFTDQRGVALPMALMSLALLLPLMLAFASLSLSEPVIAANQLRASQARALAESGVEYALHALSTFTSREDLLPGVPLPARLDGRSFIALGVTGGFTVHVADHAGGDPQVRTITAVGWVPDNGLDSARPRAHRQVVADVVAIPRPGARAPCALCVKGALDISGNVTISGTNGDPACGNDRKYGTFTRDATTVTGPAAITGGAGAGAQHQPAAAFDAVTLSPAALDALKAIALRNGTYYGPGFPNGGRASDARPTWGGRVVFDSSNRLADGVVFVDTTDGGNFTPGGATTTLAGARVEAGAVASSDGVFRGWIVVNGALDIAAGLRLRGLVYTVDALTYRSAEAGSIEGLAVALNARETPARIETGAGGAMAVTFDCRDSNGSGLVSHGFTLVPGTYREERD